MTSGLSSKAKDNPGLYFQSGDGGSRGGVYRSVWAGVLIAITVVATARLKPKF